MKSLKLKTPAFRFAEAGFKEWLDLLGYSPQTVANLPIHIRELLHYLEAHGITELKSLNNRLFRSFYERLKQRPNRKQSGGLSGSYLRKHAQAIGRFCDYLRRSSSLEIAAPDILLESFEREPITWLSREEVEELYAVTIDASPGDYRAVCNSRDRAMLTAFYACGLRRREAVMLNVSDLNFDLKTLHVKHGKGKRERIVPLNKRSLDYFEDYIFGDRQKLVKTRKEPAIFVSLRGLRIQGQTMALRMKVLQKRCTNPELLAKKLTPHTMRHSIATHLMENGMDIGLIAQFLGHLSLESTQIYTHLEEEEA